MPEDKLLVTELTSAVGNQALSLVHCESFIKWVLEQAPIAIEHDVSAILLSDSGKASCYLWFNQPVKDEYLRDFKLKSIAALNSAIKTNFSETDPRVIAFNEGEINAKSKHRPQALASFYCAPLSVRGNTLGVFAISSAKPDLFLVYRLNMFNVFAGQVALAIDSLKAREQVAKQMRIIERDRANMKNTFAGMSEGLIMTDESEQPVLLNPMARKMLGLKEGEPDAIPKDFALSVFTPLFKALAVGDKQMASKEIDLDKPQKMILRIDATVAADSEGKRMGTVILLRDITIEKEIDRLKSEFISTVSHELRTPLTTIRESVAQVLDGILGQTTPQQKEFLSICLEDIDRLARIINDLLDISKIEARKVELRKAIVGMAELVKGVSFLFLSRAKEKNLELKTNFPRTTAQIYADRDKIIQVITNLISNSFKFTEKGYIEISVTDKEDSVECSVLDTGRGIAEEDLPKVFSKFQQFGRIAGPGEKGTGLGLSIARGIVELHHGKIWVESKLNAWTKFSFVLPKYGSQEVIFEAIEKKIAEAKKENKEFSVLVISLDNYADFSKNLAEKKTQWLLIEMLEAFKKTVRAADLVIPRAENEIMVLAEVGKPGSLEMKERFKAAAGDFIFKIDQRQIAINFSYGCSTYPADADNPKDLFQKARKF
jgi:diguanylate cyclase (GGDEF)-like protein